MTFALLCPTRARPVQFKRMAQSVWATADNVDLIYTAISEEDIPSYVRNDERFGRLICPDGMPTVFKWNYLMEKARQHSKDTKLFMLAADDMIFTTPDWDKAILDHYNALENKIHVYHLRDSRDPNGTPHPIVTREYIEAMGYFLPPIFLHWFVDTWTVEIAKANNCFTHMKDYELVHDKLHDANRGDETHWGIRKMGWLTCDNWTNDHCQHFLALEKSRLKMRMA